MLVRRTVDRRTGVVIAEENVHALNPQDQAPRSSYQEAPGEGVRTITYGAHTSRAASDRSGRCVTHVTFACGREVCLLTSLTNSQPSCPKECPTCAYQL